jgi:YVTN family beta-propeller protein
MPYLSSRLFPVVAPVVGLALLGLLAVAQEGAADTLLVANKSEATVSLLDLDSGKVVATLPTGKGPHEVAVSSDGATAVVADYGADQPGSTLTVVDVPGAKVVKTVSLGDHKRPHGILFLPGDERLLVTAEASQALLVVNLPKGEVEKVIPTGQEVSHMVAVSGDGSRAFVANIGSGSITAIDLEAGSSLGNVTTGDGAEGICVSPDGSQVWVSNRGADTISLVDGKTLKVVQTLESSSFPIRAEITPDGRWVLVTNARSGDLTVIDARERKVARRVSLALEGKDPEGRLFGNRFGRSSVPIGIEIAPDGQRAYIAHAQADVIQIVDLATWKPIGHLSAGAEPDGMGYSTRKVEGAASPGD